MEAGSKQWHEFRSGRFTASECHKLMGEKGGINTQTAQSYIIDKVIGFAAYFSLLNGFEKTVYWPASQVEGHGKRFSQTYKKGFGLWKDDFNSMGKKTVLKSLISKWGILSIEMQRAVKFDQGVIKNDETEEVEYVDANTIKSFDTDEPITARKVSSEETNVQPDLDLK